MKNSYLSPAMTFVAILLLAVAAQAQSTDPLDANQSTPSVAPSAATPAASANASVPGVSKVRIVRLSQVKGAVQIDRNIGRGFETGIANLPVVEHSQVRTGVGVAEIEFEDNSSLRLAPNSLVEFPRLERDASGATASTVRLIQGSAYISLVKAQSSKAPANQFELMFGARKIDLEPATHVRLELQASEAKLAVMDGVVHVTGANGTVSIPKKKMAIFQIFDANEPMMAKDIPPSPYDAWDKDAASYHSNVATMSAFASSPYSYGTNDMMYYGNFMNAGGGCGQMWRPYFASAAWDPFANGTWAWYPGAGYSWVSPYPWAWTPYHSGSWSYCPSVGWGWMPGNGWYGLDNMAALSPAFNQNAGAVTGSSPVGGPIHAPHAPSRAPLSSEPAMVAVNSKPVANSEIASSNSFVFRKDSAGLGVPRGSLGNLQKFSHETESRGFAKTSIYASAPQTNRPNGSMTPAESMGMSIHRGAAPPPSAESSRDSYSSSFGSSAGVSSASPRSTTSAPVSTPVASSPGASRGPR